MDALKKSPLKCVRVCVYMFQVFQVQYMPVVIHAFVNACVSLCIVYRRVGESECNGV